MSIQAAKLLDSEEERQQRLLDIEQERQEKLQEMATDEGPNWSEDYKPGSFGCHELLDRTLLAGDTVEEFVLSHPACALQREWYELAEQAVSALRELYQRIGAEHLGGDNADPANSDSD
jgi:hypothetical protein